MDAHTTSLSPRQNRLLMKLGEAQTALMDAISGLDEDVCCNQIVSGIWSIKEILSHILSWNDEFRADIDAILRGDHPGYKHSINGDDDFAAWNQEQIEKRQAWTWQQLLADVERDYHDQFALIQRLAPADFRKRGVTPWKRAAREKPAFPSTADTESVETLVTYYWRHIFQHARMIRKWRKQKGY